MSIYKRHADFADSTKGPFKAPFHFERPKPENHKNSNYSSLRAAIDAETARLVKAAKSPTPPPDPKPWAIEPGDGPKVKYIDLPEKCSPAPKGVPGAIVVIQFRDWSDEYRIRARVDKSNSQPPEQFGPRISAMLSDRAARKIAESCAYVGKKQGGYSTFLTLTFTEEQRFRLKVSGKYSDIATKEVRGPTTIQKEVSRFCDSLTKMKQRGWIAEFTIHGRRISCIDQAGEALQEPACENESLLYAWVAEVPVNDWGEPNPHVHVMLKWRVSHELFPSWARRIETLWGNGFAHLEKIKDGNAAAAYMMKAVGYLTKGQKSTDQGKVRGNRYGISKQARAPDWITIDQSQLHIMGCLIADVHDHLATKYAREYQQRRVLKVRLDKAPKGSRQRLNIGRQLHKVRAVLNELPVVASKYQIILRGKAAFYEFMNWAKSPGRWKATVCSWLPEKGPGENWIKGQRPESLWLHRFRAAHYYRRAMRKMPERMSFEEWVQARGVYEEWVVRSD